MSVIRKRLLSFDGLIGYGWWFVQKVFHLCTAGKTFVNSSIVGVSGFLKNRAFIKIETVCTKVVARGVIILCRLIKKCLGAGTKRDKVIAMFFFVPVFVCINLFLFFYKLVAKVHVFFLKRENLLLQREVGILKRNQ